MPNLGPVELILILAVVIIIFGVGRLPEIGGALGRGIREFRHATKEDDQQNQLKSSVQESPPPPPQQPSNQDGGRH